MRFREQDLVRRHAGLALRDAVQLDLDPEAPARAHLRGRAGEPCGAHILDGDERVGRHELEARFEQKFLEKRVADLNGGPLLFSSFVELR